MSAILEAVRDKPLALFRTDSASPFPDASGYGRTGTVVGNAPTKSAALCSGASYSSVFNKFAIGKFASPSPVFAQGYEDRPFSLEAWAYAIDRTSGLVAQTYRENLAEFPYPLTTNDAGVTQRIGVRNTYWHGTYTLRTTLDSPGSRNYIRKTLDQTTPSFGNGDAVIQLTQANLDNTTAATGTLFPVLPDTTYTISYFQRTSFANCGLTAKVGFFDNAATPNRISVAASAGVASVANVWHRISYTFTTPSTCYFIALQARPELSTGGQAPTGATFDCTGILLEKSGTLGYYFDGLTPGYEWSGGSIGTLSRARKDISRLNLSVTPIPQTAAVGETNLWQFSNNYWAAQSTPTIETSGGPTISNGSVPKFLRKTVTVTTNNTNGSIIIGTNPDGATITPGTTGIPVTPGEVITVSMWLRNSVALTTNNFNYAFWHASGQSKVSSGSTPNQTITQNQWGKVSFTLTVPESAAWFGARTTPTVTAVGATFDATGLLVERSNSVGTYFDGTIPGAAWNGAANSSFSYLLPSDGDSQILGNSGQYDGLVINGTKVSFVTKYLTSGECRASYDLQVNRKVAVVGVHTSEKNSLYIDGNLVSETELTDAQKLDKYAVAGDGFLYSGGSNSSAGVALNAPAIYGTALAAEQISRHFAVGNRHLSRDSILKGFNGARIPLSQNEGDVFLETTWTTKEDWTNATLVNTVVQDEKVIPVFNNGVSIAGTWTDLFVMSVTDATSIYGVNMNWDGNGAIVSASVDGGTTWEVAERGKNLAIIPPGFNPQGKELMVQVSFPGGITDDPSYIDNLTVTGYLTGITPAVHGRAITYTSPAYVKNDHEPAEFTDDFGTRLNYGQVSIGPDLSDDPFLPGTVEVWFKANVGEPFYIDARTGSSDATNFKINPSPTGYGTTNCTVYINGALRTTEVMQVGEWTLMHIIPTAPVSDRIVFNAGYNFTTQYLTTTDITIGQVVLYENALTAAEIADVYQSYLSLSKLSAPDSSALILTEPANAAAIIDADWSIVSAG